MKKLFLILLFPLFLYSKTYITVYFPLEENLISKIAPSNDIKINVISPIFSNKYKELKYSDLSRFAKVDVYYHFGLDVEKMYEQDLKKINPNLFVVDLSKGIKKIDNNPYIWMDPLLLRDVAKNIYTSLVLLDEDKNFLYKDNYEALLNQFDETFLKIKKIIDSSNVFNLFVYDDYWFYYAKRFRLRVYKRAKRYLKAEDIPEAISFVEKKDIKALIVNKNDAYSIALSLARNTNIPIYENDVFSPFWDITLLELTNQLKK